MTNRASREETVARKVFDLLADIRLSPYYIGYYLAHTPHPGIYDMLKNVVEAMERTDQERQQEIKEMIVGDKQMIDFEQKCQILAGVWLKGRDELSTIGKEFYETNDVGLSLAFGVIHNLILELSEEGKSWVEDCFDNMTSDYGITEDELVGSDVEDVLSFIQ
jgi:hypothetical protein